MEPRPEMCLGGCRVRRPTITRAFFPRSPEDLSYDNKGNRLYGLTEHEGERYIILSDVLKVKLN